MPNPPNRTLALIAYPGASRAALEGLDEMLTYAGRLCVQRGLPVITASRVGPDLPQQRFDAVVVPPAFGSLDYLSPDPALADWIAGQRGQGALIASACAGAFYLGAAGLLDGRRATTHWALADRLAARFPAARIEPERVTLTDGPVLTAGGLFSWIDLGHELIARLAGSAVMREVGRFFVLDTGRRDQRLYRPGPQGRAHADAAVHRAQEAMQADPARGWRIADLARLAALSERSLHRRFAAATGQSPLDYLAALRIAVAQDLLADTSAPIDAVAASAGYANTDAFRRAFLRQTGQVPSAYRRHLRR
ncbi:GlxA family transcriptional regulator [Pararhodobacter zhoushanensis]|uniref:Helix-turn-helix domain-containing protein n=1 Tax=Pararhodobacter zhoushanensis TaxID=2479545 RepID=A0ABT3GYP7_9RHOB|nr:helix-turn-helix domain-containing protein [Pararhodobacter zhoushanensis]MCW1932659.1 helix-turn-helix domain-containing protein [Pararhodobacter zhoushanensis]